MAFRNSVALVALAAGLITGCGGGSANSPAPPVNVTPPPAPPPPPPPPPATTTEHEIPPAQTSAEIIASLVPHLAIAPALGTAKARLFVMLPGTGGTSRQYQRIVRRGAVRGYHSIGLIYPNAEAVELLCGPGSAPDCLGKARREVITGADVSPVVAVNPANSITGRLTALLTYLAATFPTEGWGQYLTGTRINWAMVTVGGHSQGAGHAGYLAKLEILDRAVMFSGPADSGSALGSAAEWLSLPNITPAARQYGFTHSDDLIVRQARATGNWGLIGIDAFGAAISVDSAPAPFASSRQLLTSAAPANDPTRSNIQSAHGAPVTDTFTPLTAAGDPLFAPVWDYLAFP